MSTKIGADGGYGGGNDGDSTVNLRDQKQHHMSSPIRPISSSSLSTSADFVDSRSVFDSLNVDLTAVYYRTSQSTDESDGEFDWVAVEKESDVVVTGEESPKIDEVEDAFSALQLMFDEDVMESEDQVLGLGYESNDSELESVDWIEPPLQLCHSRILQPYMLERLYDAFHVFQTDPSVQRMVMSLAADRAVWDAVMNNEVVRELITNVEFVAEQSKDCCSAVSFVRRLFGSSASKIMDAMERLTKYVTDLFNVPRDEDAAADSNAVLATGAAPVMEKLRMTVLLTIVVLLIVLVTRATKAR